MNNHKVVNIVLGPVFLGHSHFCDDLLKGFPVVPVQKSVYILLQMSVIPPIVICLTSRHFGSMGQCGSYKKLHPYLAKQQEENPSIEPAAVAFQLLVGSLTWY